MNEYPLNTFVVFGHDADTMKSARSRFVASEEFEVDLPYCKLFVPTFHIRTELSYSIFIRFRKSE